MSDDTKKVNASGDGVVAGCNICPAKLFALPNHLTNGIWKIIAAYAVH